MSSKRTVALPELQEEDEEDAYPEQNRQSQFQVQIIVTPSQGCDRGAEIRVVGGTPRNTNRKLPPIHGHDQSRANESPSGATSNNLHGRGCHGLIFKGSTKHGGYRSIGRKTDNSKYVINN
ncbi:hypothetical protein Zmor_006916 [Zophobas morio]|uniref:Uncharacterized protein n=1 Tax=Zophobas morio TaxID=2755281 RepID=A0AA38MNR5_9CUCU|nr:hypothetical protein Zmor_006916 [Zophobas morio]